MDPSPSPTRARFPRSTLSPCSRARDSEASSFIIKPSLLSLPMDTDEPRTPKLADVQQSNSKIVFDLPVSMLGTSDRNPLLISLGTPSQPLKGDMRMHSKRRKMAKSDEEPAGQLEASANANGDHEPAKRLSLKETRKYFCKNCGERYETFQKLGSHRSRCKSLVQMGIEKFYCKHCGKDFPTQRSASSHMGKCKSKEAAHTSARHVLQDPEQEDLW